MGTNKSKFAMLRESIPAHHIITIRDVEIAVVMLSALDQKAVNEEAELYCRKNRDSMNDTNRVNYLNAVLAYNVSRDPDNLNDKLADSIDEFLPTVTQAEIMDIVETYGKVTLESIPPLELMSEEDFDSLS